MYRQLEKTCFNGFRILASLLHWHRSTKWHSLCLSLYTMFGHLLGWYTIYTFSGALAGNQTLWYQDTSALMPKCPHSFAPIHFGTSAWTLRHYSRTPAATWQLKDRISPRPLASKTRVPGLSCATVCVFVHFGTIPACHRQMDRHTHYNGIRCDMHDATDVQNARWSGGGAVDARTDRTGWTEQFGTCSNTVPHLGPNCLQDTSATVPICPDSSDPPN